MKPLKISHAIILFMLLVNGSGVSVSAQTTAVIPNDRLTENQSGKTVISRANRDIQYQTTYMIITSRGTVIVADPYQVLKEIKADVVTATHEDYDHADRTFLAAHAGRKSIRSVETFSVKDVTVTSIASSHNGNDINHSSPSNVIYIFDLDGLRLVHLGDIGQDHLTPEQLQAIGKVDIVFMMMEHTPYYGYTEEKELNILNQLNPQVVFPTHPSASTIAEVKKMVDETLEIPLRWEVRKEDLKDGKRKLIFLNLW